MLTVICRILCVRLIVRVSHAESVTDDEAQCPHIIVHNEQGVFPFPTDRWTVVSGNKALRNRCVGDSRLLPGREGLRTVRTRHSPQNPVRLGWVDNTGLVTSNIRDH